MVVPATGTPLSIILPWRSTDTRSAISMVSLELVGNDNDALARGLELPHDPEEILHLLGGEHRGGLVQDQQIGPR